MRKPFDLIQNQAKSRTIANHVQKLNLSKHSLKVKLGSTQACLGLSHQLCGRQSWMCPIQSLGSSFGMLFIKGRPNQPVGPHPWSFLTCKTNTWCWKILLINHKFHLCVTCPSLFLRVESAHCCLLWPLGGKTHYNRDHKAQKKTPHMKTYLDKWHKGEIFALSEVFSSTKFRFYKRWDFKHED